MCPRAYPGRGGVWYSVRLRFMRVALQGVKLSGDKIQGLHKGGGKTRGGVCSTKTYVAQQSMLEKQAYDTYNRTTRISYGSFCLVYMACDVFLLENLLAMVHSQNSAAVPTDVYTTHVLSIQTRQSSSSSNNKRRIHTDHMI